MPQFIAALVLPLIVNSPVWLLGPAAVSATATGIGYLATAAGLYGLQMALTEKPDVPKAEDGKFNVRQPVPPPTYVLGRVKKSADYLALEQAGNNAFHVFSPAGHRINRHVRFYAHDEELTLDPVTGVVTAPGHFDNNVVIRHRVGLNAETAFAEMVAAMPTIWTPDHRGDGMATVLMSCRSSDIEKQQKRFPNGMPLLTEELEGMLLYDDRKPAHDPADPDTWEYSENLALQRAWHLTHPVGSKIKMEDMHWPDWNHAADVCDQEVTNKAGDDEPRYHGGFWFKANTDPVEVGRTLDEAAELVIYETAEGKVGVHAGEFVEPDIRLTEADLRSVTFDVNKRRNSTVLAVRGRFIDPTKRFNEVDAAIVGNPYIPGDNTERTRTINNAAVQRHNHIQRMQTLALIRANAPRVRFIADYEPAQDVPERRYIRVHYPPKLDEAIIEIVGDRPKLSLANLTYEFEGIVIPATLFNFTAATDEGNPPPPIDELEDSGIPIPGSFDVTIETEVVGGGQSAAFGLATWNTVSADDLVTEVEWEKVGSGQPLSSRAQAGFDEHRTGYLADGENYRFRARHWSGGTPGDWTSYIVLMAVANPTPPDVPTLFSALPSGADVDLSAKAPNTAIHKALHFWRADEATAFGSASDLGPVYGPPNGVQTDEDTPGDGSWQYWATAENLSGVHSSPTAPAIIRLGLETETEDYLDAMATKPGNVIVLAIDALVEGLKSNSLWSKHDWLSLFCLHNSQAALLNLVNPAQAGVAHGGLTFTAGAGFGGDGSSGYIGTGLNANALTQLTTNSIHLGGWFNGGSGTGLAQTCLVGTSSSAFFLSARSGSTMSSRANATVSLASTISPQSPAGYSIANRSGASARENYKNGSSVGSDTQAASSLPAVEVWFMRNSSGYAASGHVMSVGQFGGSFSGANVTAENSLLSTFRTAIGL
ncbi:hypothetical protein [Mesorhizobium sp. IMUNJ 23232]|uniref:hypothetical protein n=1 Tax=Mesorhizobium sp. IMUNJ 23232 TaxID=3376064 RepID=UPI00378FC95D